MSGTSMDGLDMCLAEVSLDNNYLFEYKIITTHYEEFDSETINFIKRVILDNSYLNELNIFLGKKYSNIVKQYFSINDMDLISMHGQTVIHIDRIKSIQAGDPSFLNNIFNVPVIYNFRYLDIEKGGNGAPLMPFLDWLLFRNYFTDVITLNIGGISNISWIRQNGSINDVIGFDTGPGMSLIDEFVFLKWGLRYDNNGLLAVKGKINHELLDELFNDDYIKRKPPKSTGREEFGINMIHCLISKFPNLDKFDFLRTLVRFTADSIIYNLKHIENIYSNDISLIISGGGINNKLLIEDIKKKSTFSNIIKSDDIGINSDIKEAFLMCVLGMGRFINLETNIPNVTGASESVLCGDIYE